MIKKIIAISILLAACNSHRQQENKTEHTVDSSSVVAPVKKFENVKFASTKDLNCGMPLSAGLEDTAHYKGKIYGFCSKECKDDFLKNPETLISAK